MLDSLRKFTKGRGMQWRVWVRTRLCIASGENEKALIAALESVQVGRRALAEHRAGILGPTRVSTRVDLDRVTQELGHLRFKMSHVIGEMS